MLERILGPVELDFAVGESNPDGPGEEKWERDYLNTSSEQQEESSSPSGEPPERVMEEKEDTLEEKEDSCDSAEKLAEVLNGATLSEPLRFVTPEPLPSDFLANLTQLATLYTELSCFRKQENKPQGLGCTTFLRRYFFLLDQERVRRMCLLCYQEQPEVQSSFMEAMLGEKTLCKFTDVNLCLRKKGN